MLRDDDDFGERILRDLEARRAARRILEVQDGAEAETLRRAYRRASLKYHPDHRPGDAEAREVLLGTAMVNRIGRFGARQEQRF